MVQGDLPGPLGGDGGGGAAGAAIVVLGVVVIGEHRAGGGVDLVVVLLVVAGIELHVVYQPAVVPIQIGTGEGYLACGEARVVQGDLPGPLGGDGGGGAAGAALVEAVGVGDVASAGEGDGAGGAVPAHGPAHELADGPDGQVDGAVIEQWIDGLSVGVAEGAGGAVHRDGVLGVELGGDLPARGGAVRGAGGGVGGAGAGQGDGEGGLIPVHVLAHELADGADGQIGGAVVGDGVNLLAGDIVKGALRAVHHDGDVGGELGGDAAGLGGAGGDGQGAGSQGGTEHQGARPLGDGISLHNFFPPCF